MIPRKPGVTPDAGIKIIKRGIFDFNELYKNTREYLEDNGYKKINFQEKEITVKEKALGKNLKVVFRASKEIDDYARFHLDIEMILEDIERIKQNNKLFDKGFLQIKTKAFIMLDYKNKWYRSKIGSFLNFVYNNYIIKDKIEDVYKARLTTELTGLQNIMKNTLNLYVK